MSNQQIADFVEANIQEFGDYSVTASDIMAKVHRLAFRRFEHGFAVIQNPNSASSLLWFVYVDAAHRGNGLGKQYMRIIQREFGQEFYLTLQCHKRLRPFYSRCGWRVVERDGDNRTMVWPADGINWMKRG